MQRVKSIDELRDIAAQLLVAGDDEQSKNVARAVELLESVRELFRLINDPTATPSARLSDLVGNCRRDCRRLEMYIEVLNETINRRLAEAGLCLA